MPFVSLALASTFIRTELDSWSVALSRALSLPFPLAVLLTDGVGVVTVEVRSEDPLAEPEADAERDVLAVRCIQLSFQRNMKWIRRICLDCMQTDVCVSRNLSGNFAAMKSKKELDIDRCPQKNCLSVNPNPSNA